MASASNSVTLWSNGGHGYTLNASFWENSTSTPNNTSNITCKATLTSQGAAWSSSYNSTLTIYWHDNRENYDRQVASINLSSLGINASAAAQGTINVTHKDDGSLSGYAYAYFTKGGTSSYTPNSGGVSNGWTALTKINRYPVLNSGMNFTDRTNPTLNITAYGTYPLRVKLEAGGNTSLITRDLSSRNSQSYTIQLTDEERKLLRSKSADGKTLAVRETVCAMNGSTELSASYKDYTMTIVRKPVKVMRDGSWVNAFPYVRVNGEWKEAKPYIRNNDSWKEEK
jgi:hypothetical protein